MTDDKQDLGHDPWHLPEHGVPADELLRQLAHRKEGDAKWRAGRTFSLVYHQSDEHTALLKAAYNLFFAENALNPGAFGSLRRLETEVVAMARDILGGDDKVTGTMSSGGTESILLAVKTYRDRARLLHPEITRPEMILPITVHPAFEKAAHYFDVAPVHVPLDADLRADVIAAEAAINKNTILLVGSAPAYPHGVVDPIEELAALAARNDLGMHVDACLGGFLLPFVRDLGHPVPAFDLRVPGVTSISADLHKYGFAAKGASTVLYRDAALRRHQFFAYTEWPGGIFGSTTLLGTRPGGAIAAAWASLRALGRDGLRRNAEELMATTRALQEGIRRIPGLRLLGAPAMSVFAYTSDEVNMLAVADAMEARGWHIDRQGRPAAIHLMITPAHREIVEPYLSDLRQAMAEVRADPTSAGRGQAAMYGMLAQIPHQEMVQDLVLGHMDELYRVGG